MGADIVVMEGSAGAGKTHALRTVAEAYREKGYRVIGTSTAWRMANQLGEDLAIESRATDAWLAQEKSGKPFLDRETVLIVDEAGQLSSRQMFKVLEAAEREQAKVILTGDQRQLQAIGAGPGLRLVAEKIGVARIDTIVRQREAWMREAVEDLSLGRADKAIEAFERRGALSWCVDGKDAVSKAVADWKTFRESNPNKTALIMAKSNKQVRALNAEMREHLRQEGVLSGDDHLVRTLDSSGRRGQIAIATGDQVLFKKRIDNIGVINGTAGVIVHVEAEASSVRMSINIAGRRIEFSANDIADDRGHMPLAHGYAPTIYSSQGATVDSAFVIADHSLKRNEIYVAASRARTDCRIYLDSSSLEKSVRARMLLDDPGRVATSKQHLRQHLCESWARPQTKSSTLDFKSLESSAEYRHAERAVRPSETKSRQMRLPRIELGR